MGKTYRRDKPFRPKKQGRVFTKDKPWKKSKKKSDEPIEPPYLIPDTPYLVPDELPETDI